MNATSISWTEKTWNPISGCTPISEGCANCYAKRMAQRLRGRCGYPADDPFRVTLHPERLYEPVRMRKPSRIFVCSMGDLFHEDVPDEFIDQVFAAMALSPQQTFLVLTKRPARMRQYLESGRENDVLDAADWIRETCGSERLGYLEDPVFKRVADRFMELWASHLLLQPLPNVWLGVSAENQARADERIPLLLQTPAAVRFVSVEPMLGPVDIESYLTPPSERVCSNCWQYREADHQEAPGTCADLGVSVQPNAAACGGFEDRWADDFESAREWLGRIDWVVCGGETSAKARPMHPDWVRSLRDQCQAAGVRFHFKSWGEWAPNYAGCPPYALSQLVSDGNNGVLKMWRVGAKTSGRLLDGREWDEYPEATDND